MITSNIFSFILKVHVYIHFLQYRYIRKLNYSELILDLKDFFLLHNKLSLGEAKRKLRAKVFQVYAS